MFYTYGEKQSSAFFDNWQMRQIAFDTMRRYLYYSEGYLKDPQIAYPNWYDNPYPIPDNLSEHDDDEEATPANRLVNQRDPHSPICPFSQRQEFATTPPQPNQPHEVVWKKKIKVDLIVPVAKENVIHLDNPQTKETDLFLLEIHGEERQMVPGEAPAPGPMLCHAAGLAGLAERFTIENEDFIRDPFFLRELYENLRDQFANLRIERERAQMRTGQSVEEVTKQKTQTLQSPRGKNGPSFRGGRIKVVFRCRTEYEYRRFWFVVQSVLGYDKLSPRPYRGLPPYDPRNGVSFAQIPMCVWQTFQALDKAVIYIFLRGDVVGRNSAGEPNIFLRGGYLCITHDTALVLRETGTVPRWVRLQDVKSFHYNSKCRRPYLAFISDPGSPDIVFIPQPPVFGPDAIRRFSPAVETLRVQRVIHETCFASLDIRRVIHIKAATQRTVRGFIESVEREEGRRLCFDACARPAHNGMSCPLPKEQLATVWRQVQQIYATRDFSVVSQSAIPLYENNTNDVPLTRLQMESLTERLSRERAGANDIVGMPVEEVQRVVEPVRRHSNLERRRGGSARAPPRLDQQQQQHVDPEPQADAAGQTSVNSPSSTYGRSRSANYAEGHHPVGGHRASSSAGYERAPRSGSEAAAMAAAAELLQAPLPTPQVRDPLVATTRSGHSTNGDAASSSTSSSALGSPTGSEEYGVPGSRYITQEEMDSGQAMPFPEIIIDKHTILPEPARMWESSAELYTLGTEMSIADMVERSIQVASPNQRGRTRNLSERAARDAEAAITAASSALRRKARTTET